MYTVERADEYSEDLHNFLKSEMPELSEKFGGVFNPANAAIEKMIEKGIFLIGRRNGEIRGIHVSWLTRSSLDVEVILLQQQIFYVKPDSGRMTYHLFKNFIDIGKREANHIITMLTRYTNIKPQTLFDMGFKELEVLYRMEISNE